MIAHNFHSEYPTEKSYQIIDSDLALVNMSRLLYSVKEFNQFDERSRFIISY